MRRLIILILICLLLIPCRADAFFQKKNYKDIFLKDAAKTEKRNNDKLAFHNNIKLLKQKVDIAVAQNNYNEAIKIFEKIGKIKPFSIEDKKFLAFLYSKTDNYSKALQIIEESYQKNPKDDSLMNLALEYSMAEKNWDKALLYTDKLLEIDPNSEKLLKNKGDLYSAKEDFANAATVYEKLVEDYPTLSYNLDLANLYMANQDFAKAQTIYESIYNAYPESSALVDAYLTSLIAQQKIQSAYWLIKKHNLEKTKNGYMISGDIAMLDNDYLLAKNNYWEALKFEPESAVLLNKLANVYRILGYINGPTNIFRNILVKNPDNLEAQLGLGTLEIDKKNYKKARQIFAYILQDYSDYRPAKIAVAHSYNANDYKLKALETLDHISDDEETKMIKAQIYYDLRMRDDAKEELAGLVSKDAEELRYNIKRDNALTIIPLYSSMYQKLAGEFKLDYQKYGIEVSKSVKRNASVFMDYNVIWYTSGSPYFLSNVVNEFRSGVLGRPIRDWEYRIDIGVKAYQTDGAMLNTNSWIKHYFNDKFNLKLGFVRNNIEQSFLSAVGRYVNGVFTGRSAYNKTYVEWDGKLPKKFYYFGNAGYGLITSANLVSNQYFEGWVGIGKALYDNPNNPWINKFSTDIVSYNSSYQYNQLKIYDSAGTLFGGYFSPGYFNATTLQVKIEGAIKKWRLKYGFKAFGGVQTAITPDQTTPTWGYSPYIAYDINDHVTFNALYNHYNYADVQRDLFFFDLTIRIFKKNGKK